MRQLNFLQCMNHSLVILSRIISSSTWNGKKSPGNGLKDKMGREGLENII